MVSKTQKNRYVKVTHFSERKFREILKQFCADLNALQVAKLTHLNRNTIEYIFMRIRKRIFELTKHDSTFKNGEIEVDESYFGGRRLKGRRGRGAIGKMKVFGMKKRGDKVYTQIVENCSAGELIPIIKRLNTEETTIYSDEWKAYDGLVNFGYKKHYRVKHSNDVFSNGKAHINGIEAFWGYAKSRLSKFRGINKKTFLLHLKECEFRYNNRNNNLYKLLLKNFRENPL